MIRWSWIPTIHPGTCAIVVAFAVDVYGTAALDWDSLSHGWLMMPDDGDYTDPPRRRAQLPRGEPEGRPP